MEAHGISIDAIYDQAKTFMKMTADRPHVLRDCIQACRKGGTISVSGVYGGLLDKLNFGAAFAKGLTLKMGQAHVHRYMRPLLERIQAGAIDPSFVITHRLNLEDAPEGYKMFTEKANDCIKIVMKP
jgi:threonine dehydrogenase-like Zn-dependent dehydrogenase